MFGLIVVAFLVLVLMRFVTGVLLRNRTSQGPPTPPAGSGQPASDQAQAPTGLAARLLAATGTTGGAKQGLPGSVPPIVAPRWAGTPNQPPPDPQAAMPPPAYADPPPMPPPVAVVPPASADPPHMPPPVTPTIDVTSGREAAADPLSSSLDSNISTSLGDSATDANALAVGPQIIAPPGDIEARVLELMAQNYEVMAVRLVCDEMQVGILDAHKTVRAVAGLPSVYE